MTRMTKEDRQLIIEESCYYSHDFLLKSGWDGSVPIDLSPLVRSIGIHVHYQDLTIDLRSSLVKTPEGIIDLVINTSLSPGAKRHFLAMNIAHVVEQEVLYESQKRTYSYIHSTRDKDNTASNIFAHYFAVDMLIPTDEFIQFDLEGLTDAQMAKKFVVTVEDIELKKEMVKMQEDDLIQEISDQKFEDDHPMLGNLIWFRSKKSKKRNHDDNIVS